MARTRKNPDVETAQLAATVPTGVKEYLEDIRWSERMSMSELVAAILGDWVADHKNQAGDPVAE